MHDNPVLFKSYVSVGYSSSIKQKNKDLHRYLIMFSLEKNIQANFLSRKDISSLIHTFYLRILSLQILTEQILFSTL